MEVKLVKGKQIKFKARGYGILSGTVETVFAKGNCTVRVNGKLWHVESYQIEE